MYCIVYSMVWYCIVLYCIVLHIMLEYNILYCSIFLSITSCLIYSVVLFNNLQCSFYFKSCNLSLGPWIQRFFVLYYPKLYCIAMTSCYIFFFFFKNGTYITTKLKAYNATVQDSGIYSVKVRNLNHKITADVSPCINLSSFDLTKDSIRLE